MIGFLKRLIGLRDEGGGPLDALLAVGDLLGELPNPLCLGRMAKGSMRTVLLGWIKLLNLECMKMPSAGLRCCGLLRIRT